MAERTAEPAQELLRRHIAELGRVVVAFSGGVDSALLARVALDVLGPDSVMAVTAVSEAVPAHERDEAAAFAEEWSIPWSEVTTDEMSDPAYVANDGDRCARCKDSLMDVLEPIAVARDATVVLGVNTDDLGDHRPGQSAAAARGARFPLAEAGFTKEMIRDLARSLGLGVADKPAAPCLASRIPYGTPVTLQRLRGIAAAEHSLRELGFGAVRVRHYGQTARLEIPVEEMQRVLEMREQVVAAVRSGGYEYVTLDLEGLRSGNLNSALSRVAPPGSTSGS